MSIRFNFSMKSRIADSIRAIRLLQLKIQTFSIQKYCRLKNIGLCQVHCQKSKLLLGVFKRTVSQEKYINLCPNEHALTLLCQNYLRKERQRKKFFSLHIVRLRIQYRYPSPYMLHTFLVYILLGSVCNTGTPRPICYTPFL